MRKMTFLAVLVLVLTVSGAPTAQSQTVACSCVCVDDARALDTCYYQPEINQQAIILEISPAIIAIYSHVGNCAATSTLGSSSAIIVTTHHVAGVLMKMVAFTHDQVVATEGAGDRIIYYEGVATIVEGSQPTTGLEAVSAEIVEDGDMFVAIDVFGGAAVITA